MVWLQLLMVSQSTPQEQSLDIGSNLSIFHLLGLEISCTESKVPIRLPELGTGRKDSTFCPFSFAWVCLSLVWSVWCPAFKHRNHWERIGSNDLSHQLRFCGKSSRIRRDRRCTTYGCSPMRVQSESCTWGTLTHFSCARTRTSTFVTCYARN